MAKTTNDARTKLRGLTAEEVVESRRLHGANVLTPPPRESLWKRYFEKLTGPLGHRLPGWHDGDSLVFILELAAMLSILISFAEYFGWLGLQQRGATVFFEPLGILIAILLATGISFIFELKADHEFALLGLTADEQPVQVVRDGHTTTVPRRDIVCGDVVLLSTGDEIPADAQLIDATLLSVDESSLTGEPLCHKSVDADAGDHQHTYPVNHVMRGTKVMEGHAVCEVFAVGDHTENGRVFRAAQIDDSVRTPLNEQLDGLGRTIALASYIIAAAVVVGRIVSYSLTCDFEVEEFMTYMLQTFMIVVALIAVAVPEGLPMAVTLALAYSMRRMLKTNNMVRRLHACETMGAATVICTDKTGTLTQNQMQVTEMHLFNSPPDTLLAEAISLNSTANLDVTDKAHPVVLGNPTEGALLLWLRQRGVDYRQLRADAIRVNEVPFSTERKYMATTLQRSDSKYVMHVKGAPEIILDLCGKDLDAKANSSIKEELSLWQQRGLRTLALAYAQGDTPPDLHEAHLRLLAVVAISDPVRSDVPAAIEECQRAGIKVKIVTGDTTATAVEIARQIGLLTKSGDEGLSTITGPELEALDDKTLQACVGDICIIARARPMDKKRLVEALQARGEVVAVTGDGTNDAPALKAAHVGLSMGSGTSVAKEASDITILDNSFASIGRAVMWGRSLYQNVQRFILFQMTVNVCACLIVLAGAFLGPEAPLTVTQMLWVNLIMDTFAAMALAALPPSEHVMNDAPRDRRAFIINRAMQKRILGVGLGLFAVLLGLLRLLQECDVTSLTSLFTSFTALHTTPHDGHTPLLTPYEQSLFFTIFVMLQFWNLFNARAFASGGTALNLRGCKGFLFIAAVILVGQILIVNFGGPFMGTVPLSLTDWLLAAALTAPVLLIGEVTRMIRASKAKHRVSDNSNCCRI